MLWQRQGQPVSQMVSGGCVANERQDCEVVGGKRGS